MRGQDRCRPADRQLIVGNDEQPGGLLVAGSRDTRGVGDPFASHQRQDGGRAFVLSKCTATTTRHRARIPWVARAACPYSAWSSVSRMPAALRPFARVARNGRGEAFCHSRLPLAYALELQSSVGSAKDSEASPTTIEALRWKANHGDKTGCRKGDRLAAARASRAAEGESWQCAA